MKVTHLQTLNCRIAADDSTMESLNHFPRNELGHAGTLSRSVVAGHPLWSCCYFPIMQDVDMQMKKKEKKLLNITKRTKKKKL